MYRGFVRVFARLPPPPLLLLTHRRQQDSFGQQAAIIAAASRAMEHCASERTESRSHTVLLLLALTLQLANGKQRIVGKRVRERTNERTSERMNRRTGKRTGKRTGAQLYEAKISKRAVVAQQTAPAPLHCNTCQFLSCHAAASIAFACACACV